jgi:hypothetical protein
MLHPRGKRRRGERSKRETERQRDREEREREERQRGKREREGSERREWEDSGERGGEEEERRGFVFLCGVMRPADMSYTLGRMAAANRRESV